MKFTVDERIFEKFPGLHLGVLVAKGMDNRGTDEVLWEMMEERQRQIRREFTSTTLSQHPRIAAWRSAYSAFGAKPKKYKSSVESLFRMTLKGLDLKHINKVVDVYNLVSLRYMVPVGGDDMSCIEGYIRLAFAKGGETFRSLNSAETEVVKQGEVVYRDSVEVLCRRWNWRECDKTKMRELTKDVVLVVEGLPPVTRADVQEILAELFHLVERYCGGDLWLAILDVNHLEIDL